MPFFFAFTLFLSATLLFLVQPMIAKMVLPNLGGTPAVWNTCMVFFQALLLAGYTYAHVATTWLGVRRQALVHCLVLFLPLLALPIGIRQGWLPEGDANPVPWLLGFLVVTTGLPFFVVSASAPLLQKWFASTGHPSAGDPYFLYAASNLGSMLALISYPALVEPNLPLQLQSKYWALGYCALALLTMGCAYLVWRTAPPPPAPASRAARDKAAVEEANRPTAARRLRWIALAFVPSSLMLGATTYITTDIAAIPLLWVLPLSLYLLSFIIVFAKMPPWLDKLVLIGLFAALTYSVSTLVPLEGAEDVPIKGALVQWLVRLAFVPSLLLLLPQVPPLLHRTMVVLLPLVVLLLVFVLMANLVFNTKYFATVPTIVLHLVLLFVAAMVCHGELARDRPAPAYLTEFYLEMSLGGVLGGLFNGLLAPLIFTQLTEYPLAMIVACMLVPPLTAESKSRIAFILEIVLAVSPGLLAAGLLYMAMGSDQSDLTSERLRAFLDRQTVRSLALLLAALAILVVYIFYRKEERLNRFLDVLAAGALGLLAAGLIFGLPASKVIPRLVELCEKVPLLNRLSQDMLRTMLRTILSLGLPIILAYTLLARPVRFGLAVGALLLAANFSDALDSRVVYRDRSFFGVLTVKEYAGPFGGSRQLVHGTTLHGKQFLDPEHHRDPLTYYHPTGPIGQVFEDIIKPGDKKNIALIGLGTGTLASYADAGQHFTFYEIDKAVLRISRDSGLFTYYPDAVERGADMKVVLGDARLRLREAADDQYDLIVVDAFSSDAIPIHLITREALAMFREKLAPGGIVAFHTSNRYLYLEPVVGNLAKDLGMVAIVRNDHDDDPPGKTSSTWVLVAREEKDFGKLAQDIKRDPEGKGQWEYQTGDPTVGVWTDDYSNLLSVFNWKAK